MMIQVLSPLNESNTIKGNLLEDLASEFLQTQGYSISTNVRTTASELDLLCSHKVNSKEIYVECKAYTDTLPANILTNLLGTITLHDHSEGWLISTGELGKDAKGFVDKWEKKPSGERERLSIYTPERILQALLGARIVCEKPVQRVKYLIADHAFSIGDWILLITTWGKFWACPVLFNGVAKNVAVFSADHGKEIFDLGLYDNLKKTGFIFKDIALFDPKNYANKEDQEIIQQEVGVVPVEYGEKWFDYRPARPEHFVGRKRAQRDLLRLFSDVKKRRTLTRVFAVTGDSGIGKSSLIAKMRDVAKGSQKPNNLFLYAVDVRAANDSTYVYAAIIEAFRCAEDKGFGYGKYDLKITNYADPLRSESIFQFLEDCRRKGELIILIFDQFEELYSKPELFSVFNEARKLMFSTIAAANNFVLGFAWKSDSTVPQDHPAYHMWHELDDHRYAITLKQFSHSDAEQSLRLFEKEIGEKLLPELRKYLLENCKGYPWLLKKLCIHFYEQLESGSSQHRLANSALDISSLFDRDLNKLSETETKCLRHVAQNAPMDWFEVLEIFGTDIVRALQDKRLLIKRGNKLNLYWDIFRDYVLSGSVPVIPFNYIPQSPSLDAMLRVSLELDSAEGKNIEAIASRSKLKASSVQNVVHDLMEFGVATGSYDNVFAESHFDELSERTILLRLRVVFCRHSLVELLRCNNSATPASQQDVVAYLQVLNPTAQYHTRTWNTYANRLRQWLLVLGYIAVYERGIIFKDAGDVVLHAKGARLFRNNTMLPRVRQIFIGDAPPAIVVEALLLLITKGPKSYTEMKAKKYRNACSVLHRFGVVELDDQHFYKVCDNDLNDNLATQCVWENACCEESVQFAVDFIKKNPTSRPKDLGHALDRRFQKNWRDGSKTTVGKNIRHWARWLMTPKTENGELPKPPGRSRKADKTNGQRTLFD